MSPTDARADWLQQELAEHMALRSWFGAIESSLKTAEGATGALVAELAELRERLAEHFRSEEAGAYFAEVTRRAPHLAHRAELLVADHRRLLRDADSVVGLARSAVAHVDVLPVLSAEFHALRRAVEEHEHAENALLQESYAQDLGGVD